MKPELLIMAVIGAMIGEGIRMESEALELRLILHIAASAFLAYLAAQSVNSLVTVDDGILITIAGLLGYLGDQYSKGWLLKVVKRYDIREKKISENLEREAKKNQKPNSIKQERDP